MEPEDQKPPISDLVDQLLRDKDFLLAREIRHRVDELNRMLEQAQGQNLRIEARTASRPVDGEDPVVSIDVRIFREI